MLPNPQETVDLVTFTEVILNGKLCFLCSVCKCQGIQNKIAEANKAHIFCKSSRKIYLSIWLRYFSVIFHMATLSLNRTGYPEEGC